MSDIAIQYLPISAFDAKFLASHLGVAAHEIALHHFPDGEMRVTVGPATSTVIVYASLHQPNEKLIALLFATESLRRQGSQRLVLLAPYFCYMRFHAGEAISQRAIGQLMVNTVDRVITVDSHLHRTSDIRVVCPGIEADNLSAMPVIMSALRSENIDPATIVIGPDSEARQWVGHLAECLGLTYTVAQKVRNSDRSVELRFANCSLFAGRPADNRRYRIVRRRPDRVREISFGRRGHDHRRRRHACAVPAGTDGCVHGAGIHSIRRPTAAARHQYFGSR